MADIIDNGVLSKDPIRVEFELYSAWVLRLTGVSSVPRMDGLQY